MKSESERLPESTERLPEPFSGSPGEWLKPSKAAGHSVLPWPPGLYSGARGDRAYYTGRTAHSEPRNSEPSLDQQISQGQ
eukprot:759327-Hanusia_phi.AAC.14